jgi:hypothetical protein
MPPTIQDFRAVVATGATRVHADDQNGVRASAIGLGGRAIAWMSETFGSGKDENRAAVGQLVDAIRAEMGEAAGDAAQQSLAAVQRDGRPLSARKVERVLGNAESLVAALKEQRVSALTDLGANHPVLADMVRARVADGRIDQELGRALLAAPHHRDALLADARRVLQEQERAVPGRPTPLPQSLLALEGALDRAVARSATADAVHAMYAPADDGGPSAIERMATQQLRAAGLDAAALLAHVSTANWRAAEARAVGMMPKREGGPTEEDVRLNTQVRIRDLVPDALRAGLNADDPAIHAMMRDLDLGQVLDAGNEVADMLGRAINRALTDVHPTPARELLVEHGLAALRRLSTARPDAAQEIGELAKTLSLTGGNALKLMSREDRAFVLTLEARGNVAAMAAERANPNHVPEPAATSRAEAMVCLGEVIGIRLRMIQDAHGLGPAAALARLPQDYPDLVALVDKALADGGASPAPGAWLDNRRLLLEGRGKLEALLPHAQPRPDGTPASVGGNDLQRLFSASVRELSMQMFRTAIDHLGPPPGPFTVLSVGSTARGEASPYSDVEFAILLPDGYSQAQKDYAVSLSAHVRDQVVALGEGQSSDRKEGMHWDAGFNPVTAQDSFIGSATELVDANLRNGDRLDAFTLTMMTNSEWLFAEDALPDENGVTSEPDRSWQAVKDMHAAVAGYLAEPHSDTQSTGQEIGQVLMRKVQACVDDGLAGVQAGEVDVKWLGRLPMLLAQGLALEHGITQDAAGVATNSTHLRLEALVQAGVLSRADADTVMEVQDMISSVRVRAHLFAGAGVDKVSVEPEPAGGDGRFHAPELRALLPKIEALAARCAAHGADPSQPF